MAFTSLKERMYEHCLAIVKDRMATIQSNLDNLMDAKTSETKSSAGDKYETGMAMIQNQEELYTRQLADTSVVLQNLQLIEPTKPSDRVENGALVILPVGMFYVCAGMGKQVVDSQEFYAISLISPLGAALKFKKASEPFTFNDKTVHIQAIF